jgi:hypothetical protein
MRSTYQNQFRLEDVMTYRRLGRARQQVHEKMQALDVAARLTPEVLQRIDDVLGNKP